MPKLIPLRTFQNDSARKTLAPAWSALPSRNTRGQKLHVRAKAAILDMGVSASVGTSGSPSVSDATSVRYDRDMVYTPHPGMTRNSKVTDNRPMGAGPRILVVDDNDDNRYTLKLHLDLEGYTDVETARDGEEAIALLETSAFDLVLLDVMMPKVDGFQVLTWLKDQARLRDLPVIMISALTEMNSMARCIELGAVDYLLKPFNPVLLKARLGATLEKKRLRDEVDAHLARLQEELDAARRLQMAMVPQSFPAPSPDFPIDLYASMEPAREVGGDLYDFFVTEDGMLCFLVGDVSGKGMAAALFMARTKSLIRIATELMRSRQGTSV